MAAYRRKMIEVALPLEAINHGCKQEKNPFLKGHPRNIHLWWARRPLAACRAVLFASLVDDPDDDPAYANYDAETREHMAGEKRQQLFELIEELVKWENSNNELVINAARAEIARCVASRKIELGELKKDKKLPGGETVWDLIVKGHGDLKKLRDGIGKLPKPESVNAFLAEFAPPALDPFCGGGSIPLEAQRLGLRAYGSDLNPVPVLITKALIEIPPKFANKPPVNPEAQKILKTATYTGAQGLAEDVRYYGQWIRNEAEKRIGYLYPKVKITKEMAEKRLDLKIYIGQELTVIAWLWARTIKCPNPGCLARTPLIRSFWVSTKKGKSLFAEPILDHKSHTVRFEFQSKGEPPKHTTDRTGARCLFCNTFIKKPELRNISIQHGLETIPLAIVAEGKKGLIYLSGDTLPLPNVKKPDVPFLEQPITNDRRWFSPPLYGMPNFADLFTPRQLIALTTYSELIKEAQETVLENANLGSILPNDNKSLANGGNGQQAYADAVATYLACSLSHLSRYSSTLCGWNNTNQNIAQVFGRQALPMVWDFAEGNCIEGVLGFDAVVEWVAKAIAGLKVGPPGKCDQLDVQKALLCSNAVISTDPPYYDNMGYADLSDFFYVWLRHALTEVHPMLFSTLLTPKVQELIASSHRHDGNKDKAQVFFEEGFGKAFSRMSKVEHSDYPLTVYYAFKQAEDEEKGIEDGENGSTFASTGWETMLEGLIRSGFSITGTWPVHTEREKGLKGNVNALASSIVLVCRPRPENAMIATRKEYITALRRELPEALKNLQRGNIAPVDLAQASIGPGMAIFTRYAKVMEADGNPMSVRATLSVINQALDEVLAEQEGEFDGDTRWALAWFEQFGMEEGPYGVAETLSKPKNTAMSGLAEDGIIAARSGKVKLIDRAKLPADWNPATDKRLTIWEIAQHLIQTLETKGESEAADLLRKVGGLGETARDLAYRLYSLCERKKWAQEALAYNSLVVAWPEITKLAAAGGVTDKQKQNDQKSFFDG